MWRYRILQRLLFTMFFLFISKEIFPQTWQLDTSFGNNGIAVGGILLDVGKTISSTIQSDGKIIVAGGAFPAEVVRFNPDGTLDSTFGKSGVVDSLPIDRANAVVTQANGKIIFVGDSLDDIALVQLNTNGDVDSTFGTNGVSINSIGVYEADAYSATVQNDGKIIVAGYSSPTYSGSRTFTLIRYNSNGTFDNTFGTDGIVTTNMSNSDDFVESVVIQGDMKIVAAGYSGYLNPTIYGSNSPALARYNPDGSLDSTFGSNGIDTMKNFSGKIHSVALQGDGKMVAAGYSGTNSNADFVTFRFNSDGSLDDTFGTNGAVTTSFSQSSYAHSVAVQIDGKVVVTGYADVGFFDSDFATVRFNPDGTLDNTFGMDGKITTPIGTSSIDKANAVVIQNDGKIIVAGYAEITIAYSVLDVFAAVRYGIGSATGVNEKEIEKTPNNFTLKQNYPNPFNPTTTIEYSIPATAGLKSRSSNVKLVIFDVIGRKIKTLVNKNQQSGNYSVQFDANSLPSGIYYYTLKSGNFKETKKMILLK